MTSLALQLARHAILYESSINRQTIWFLSSHQLLRIAKCAVSVAKSCHDSLAKPCVAGGAIQQRAGATIMACGGSCCDKTDGLWADEMESWAENLGDDDSDTFE